MLFMILMTNLIMSINFIITNHPLSMGLILMIQTFLISFISGTMSPSFWFSYMIFLIMIGGMLILFMYMTSMASNEMFKFSNKNLMFFFMFIMIMLISFFLIKFLLINNMSKNINNNDFYSMFFMKNEITLSTNKIYNSPNMMITIMLINYLFFTLIVINKIINYNEGPLRQKF
uniref:NADH-ubiquinone oxidoreductase chain 6 n=1 Tax=Peltodytes quadratus TaxID=1050041 RepID=S4SUY5_9COLE|nr:NADH dehydrogenase subunit 6 [Peltodytes quadratus]